MLGGRYRLDERIASGGMGDVWRGSDEVLGRTVAVKVLLAALLEEPGFAERFRGEARTMATINHPGVVDVYDYGNENGTAFLVMEYIEGDALSRTLSRVGRLTPARTMALVAQAADALHAAHEKGIVHRDVKPGNLLVRPNGTLVLTDFGIARSAAVGQLTSPGSVLGTASYISPEQAAGQQATPLSDVYALGVVAYQCLSGRRPFEGDNPLEIALRHVRDQAPPLPPDIPPPARQVVETAMAKDPAARYPTAAALGQVARHAAGQLAGGTTSTRPPAAMPGSPAAAPPGSPVGMPGSPVAAHSASVSGPPAGPTSGPPGGPVSGPGAYPGGPISGPPAPISGGPGGPGSPGTPPGAIPGGPAGTRIMPSGPDGPGGPPLSSGPAPGPGQFARGSAGVPPPPQRPSDTGYTYVGTSQFPGGQDAGQPAGGGGASTSQRDPRKTGLIALAAGIGALLLILCIGGGVFLVNNLGNDSPGNDPTTPATTPAPAEQLAIDCDKMKGDPLEPVKTHLEKDGFKVKVTEVDDNSRKGTVVDVPCSAPVGSEVEVKISSGRGGGGGGTAGPSGDPAQTCTPGFLGGIAGSRCPTPGTSR
jgi:serine/threonine-protein kinase